MSKKLKIGVGDARETAQGFIEAWRRAEQGERPDVKALERLELITRTVEGEIQVPWETVLAEMKLAA